MNENNPKNSLKLYGMDEYFDTLSNLNKHKKIPKVLMLSGEKGSGMVEVLRHLSMFILIVNLMELAHQSQLLQLLLIILIVIQLSTQYG